MTTATLTEDRVLFEESIRLTNITDFGLDWNDFLAGRVAPPREGAQFYLDFEGRLEGEKISGTIKGRDYLTVRGDGRFCLHIHAIVTTDDGERLALFEDGVLLPPSDDSGIAGLRLSLTFSTASPKYAWLNRQQVWAAGSVDQRTGEGKLRGYLV